MPTAPPTQLPDPLIYGTPFPELRLVMRDGKQFAESRSNENLRTCRSSFDDYGTLTAARLIELLGICHQTHAGHEGWCPMVSDIREFYDEDTGEDESGWGVQTDGPPTYSACPAVTRLADYCQTTAQRRFFDLWHQTFVRRLSESWRDGMPPEKWSNLLSLVVRDRRLSYPALIPEVWLNYLGPAKSADDELHLAENPSRVDFVVLAEGRKCVIEIDGKSHFADYNRAQNKWTPDERLYTRNLKIERSLRRQGWEIHRFSDLEVNSCSPDTFGKLVRDLPDNIQAWRDTLTPNEVPF